MPRIGKQFVDTAPPGRHYDGALPGFGVYVGKRRVSYFVEYRPARRPSGPKKRHVFAVHGAPHPLGGVWTPERARREAMRLLALVREGADPAAERRRRTTAPTVAEVAAEWLERDQRENRAFRETERIVRVYVVPALGDVPLAELHRSEVLALVEDIARTAPVMANRVFARIRRMCRWALARGLIERDPTAGLRPPARERPRERVLDDRELALVWRAAEADGPPFGAIVRLLILTGCRREEIGALRWAEVKDLEGPEPRIELSGERTKTGEPRIVPLSAPAAEVLRALPRLPGPHVFGDLGRGPFQGWSRARRRLDRRVAELAGGPLPPWRLHDLRRTCATGLQRLGVRLEVTEAVLGHIGSRGGIVGVYQRHRYEAEKREALGRWARHVLALLGEAPGVVVPLRRS